MGFIESYKHLEKLCGELLNDDRRVSAYIDEMINTPRGSYLVRGWDDDLRQLKHYRWVRNQIVHELNCTEANMCQTGDAAWLDDFYSRIMTQTDPLALYAQAARPHPVREVKQTAWTHPGTSTDMQYKRYTQMPIREPRQDKKSGCVIAVLAILAAVIFSALISVVLK